MPDESRARKYAIARAKGLDRRESAIQAGFSVADAGHLEERGTVQAEIDLIRKEARLNCGVSKEDVIEGFKRAAQIAEALEDATGLVAAWREIAKCLGYYAPEVKKIEKGIKKADLLNAMAQLSDEDLAKLSHGRVIDGEVLPDGTQSLPAVPPE